MVKIRKGTKQDILKVSRLWLAMVRELKPEFTPNVGWWRKHAEGFISSGRYNILVAEEGGRCVGFLDFFVVPDPSTGKRIGVAQHFFLLPQYRGSYIARLLYKQALADAKAARCQAIELSCRDNEKPGWEKKGYRLVSSRLRREYV